MVLHWCFCRKGFAVDVIILCLLHASTLSIVSQKCGFAVKKSDEIIFWNSEILSKNWSSKQWRNFKYWSLSFFAFLVATFVTLGKYIFRTPIGNLLAFFQRLSVMIRCIIIVNMINNRAVTVSSSKLDTSHLFGSPSKTPASLWINNCSSRAETSNHSNCV